jgi:transcription initiation factor TFIIIB Brf1 subunit/transcription initiation factor TFIIB
MIPTPFDTLEDTADLDPTLTDTAREFLRTWDGWQYGISPSGAAASAYYAAAVYRFEDHEHLHQATVAELFDTSGVTIRTHYPDVLDAQAVDA